MKLPEKIPGRNWWEIGLGEDVITRAEEKINELIDYLASQEKKPKKK